MAVVSFKPGVRKTDSSSLAVILAFARFGTTLSTGSVRRVEDKVPSNQPIVCQTENQMTIQIPRLPRARRTLVKKLLSTDAERLDLY